MSEHELQSWLNADCTDITDLSEFVSLSKQVLGLRDLDVVGMMGLYVLQNNKEWHDFLHKPTFEQVLKFQRIVRRLCRERDEQRQRMIERLTPIRDRLRLAQNFWDDAFFLETLKLGQESSGQSDRLLAKSAGKNATTINNWRHHRGSPNIEERSNILNLLAQGLQCSALAITALDLVQVFKDHDAAILNRDRQDPEGDVDTAEPTSGGSGE
jgi:hypothetical protein